MAAYPPEVRADVLSRREAGQSMPQIARETGLSLSSVHRWCASGQTQAAKIGRRSSYDPTYHPELVERLVLLGATDEEIAGALGIHRDTLFEWKAKPEISDAYARGGPLADAKMAKSLYQRGIGYEAPAVKIFMPAGAEKPVYAPYIEHYPPDTNAASLWLRNRRGANRKKDQAIQWSERVEHTGADGGPISLEALLLRADELPGDRAKVVDGKAEDVPSLPKPDDNSQKVE